MELVNFLDVVRRRWWVVVLALVICIAGSGAFSLLQPKVYTSSLQLLVPTGNVAINQGRLVGAESASAYAQFAMTIPAIAAATEAAAIGQTPVSVTATADGANPFFEIVAQSPDPEAAQQVAQAYLQVLPQVVLMLQKTPNASPPEFTVLQQAVLPTEPSAPRPIRNMLIGAALGLILGLAVAVLRETLDGRVRDGVQLERVAEVALLGLIPKEFRSVAVPAMNRPKSRRAEAYRAVRTNLEFLSVKGMPRSVVVTSAFAGEGKSSLSANLGVVASRAGRDVVIVDADLRKPTLAKYFGLDSPIGLTDVLVGRWSIDEALQRIGHERLWVLSSGPVPTAPGELVGSAAMASLIEELEHRFDFVIIDTPPVLPVSDSLSMAVNVDGVVLVARMRDTTRRSVQKAAEAVRKVNATLLGVVGNVAVANGEDSIYGYSDGYRSRAKLDESEAYDTADELQPLEAAGRRRRDQSSDEVPGTRRARRRGESAQSLNGASHPMNGAARGASGVSGDALTGPPPSMRGAPPAMNGSSPGFNGASTVLNGASPGFHGAANGFNGPPHELNGAAPGVNGVSHEPQRHGLAESADTAPRGVRGFFDVDLRSSDPTVGSDQDGASAPFAPRPRGRGFPPDHPSQG